MITIGTILAIILAIGIMAIIAHFINSEDHLLFKVIVYFTTTLILTKGTILKYAGIQSSPIYPLMDIVSNVFLSIIALSKTLMEVDKKYPDFDKRIINCLKHILDCLINILKKIKNKMNKQQKRD